MIPGEIREVEPETVISSWLVILCSSFSSVSSFLGGCIGGNRVWQLSELVCWMQNWPATFMQQECTRQERWTAQTEHAIVVPWPSHSLQLQTVSLVGFLHVCIKCTIYNGMFWSVTRNMKFQWNLIVSVEECISSSLPTWALSNQLFTALICDGKFRLHM